MSKSDTTKKTRTRLSPKARKNMILDCAAKLVGEEGVSAVTMERLGTEAAISKALVYNYFPSVKLLLQTLLTREYRHLRRVQLEAAESAETLEQMVRRVTKVYLSYISDRGLIIERLSLEPSVANSGDPNKYGRDPAVNYIAEILCDNFNIDMEVARATVDISYGMPTAAGQYLIHNDISLQMIEDITVAM
ncbi:TetR/AcrR family transcriptional regulator, partial [Porticoccaceae bacterium]|nr:TetR/AcrR family transcriptional regulator [Porticoccaceae bacterium]